MDSERLMQMAGGDKGLAVFVQERLKELARGSAGPVWQEIARDVLKGQVDLRDAVLSETYGDEVSRGLARFVNWYGELNTHQRQELETEARRHLDVLGKTRNLD